MLYNDCNTWAVIKDGQVHAEVNGIDRSMSLDDFTILSKLVENALQANMNASFIDDKGIIHALNK